MTRPILAVVAISVLTPSVSAQTLPRVAVITKSADASGFTDPGSKDRSSLRNELAGQLRDRKKTMEVVDASEPADVTIEIVKAGIGVGTTSRTTVISFTRSAETRASKEWQAVAILRAGDYSTELSAAGLYQVIAAKQLARDIERWINDNRAKLLSRRAR